MNIQYVEKSFIPVIKAEFSASFLQSDVLLNIFMETLILVFFSHYSLVISKEQHLFKIEGLLYIIKSLLVLLMTLMHPNWIKVLVFLSKMSVIKHFDDFVSVRREWRVRWEMTWSELPGPSCQINPRCSACPRFGLRDNLIKVELLKNEDAYTYIKNYRCGWVASHAWC